MLAVKLAEVSEVDPPRVLEEIDLVRIRKEA
jgi:hypothetical protein